ncbi:DUF6088 family protein [Roseateles oligotrophus]|uniref:DUF6088 family protein n=1 Tax=Roseateles oligotrophus TaxID=1769250 RepID=A0ABT2Y9M7_9BURK|nr:DUF6088 family protein [Roseateles oligotrophus]MCV2367017.1 DUF6088 family protein [Roseateles oligotrophus]
MALQRGEAIVSHGAGAANALGLTTQVPMRAIYLTSGRCRSLKLVWVVLCMATEFSAHLYVGL